MGILQKAVGFAMNTAAGAYWKRFDGDTRRAMAVNESVLKNILDINKDTEYGRRYNFAQILTKQEYKAAVPLATYEDYKEYIDKMAEGKCNILTSEPVKYFGLTSGTTGSQKLIPITSRARRVVSGHMGLLIQGVLFNTIPDSRRFDKGLILMNTVTSGLTRGGIPTGAGTSGGMMSMKRVIPYLWTSPPEILQITNQPDANYLHLLFALKEKNLMYIGSTFTAHVLNLFKHMEKTGENLVEDIARGKITKGMDLDPQIRSCLEKKLHPDPARADAINKEFERGFEGIAKRIWPGLLYLNCVAGGDFSIYVDKLRFYILDLPIHSAVYASTEAIIGVSLKPGEPSYVVTPRTAYHEFIPFNEMDSPNPVALDLDQLSAGKKYEVVVTNLAGLYRYRLGDIVKMTGYYHQSPVIEFLYRRGQLINLAGEKTSEQAVCRALSQAVKQWGHELVDFTTMADYDISPGRYIFFVEVNNPAGLSGATRCPGILEETIGRANPRYLAARRAGRIAPLKLIFVKAGTFDRLAKILMEKGASANQLKIPRLIRDGELANFLRERTLNSPV